MHESLLRTEGVLVHGHRGCGTRTEIPENTLPSFSMAMEAGVDGLELDVRLTRDGVPVLMHDSTLDRTTNATGPIAALTLAELREVDAGIRGGERWKGLAVPTLEEFCELVRPAADLALNVELKDHSREAVDKTVAMLDRFGLIGRCVFTCFNATVVHDLYDRHRLPCQGFVGFRMQNFVPGVHGTFARMAAVGIGMQDLTPERVRDFTDMGILPWAWCPDDEAAVRFAMECGVRLITVNRLGPALKLCKDIQGVAL